MAERPDSQPEADAIDPLDPELIALPRPRPRVGLVLAASIVVGCGYLLFTLRDDLRFSMAGEATRVTVATAAASTSAYVAVDAIPDRTLVASVADSPGDLGGYRVVPVLGSADKLWIALDRDPWSAPDDYNRTYTGRLRDVDEVAFGDELSRWVAEQPPTPRPMTAAALRKALTEPTGRVQTPSGGTLAVFPQTPVAITEIVPARAQVTAFASSIATEAAWEKALTEAGILAPGAAPSAHTESSWTYVVEAPEGVAAIHTALAQAELFGAIAQPVSHTHFGQLGDLEATAAGVVIGGDTVPWSHIDAVLVLIPRTVPGDARILIAGEAPSDYALVLPAVVALAGFLALFGWAFVRAIRRELPQRAGA
ncbi:MAG TPA: hypothetical protein VFG83_02470 [Kofleriaceae bacterium]|nr:hypothetical protein [Kofleriaceae bacterium]